MTLTNKKIGYLRRAPEPGNDMIQPGDRACSAMWRKLCESGYLAKDTVGEKTVYGRTAQGQAEIERFDRYLSPELLAIVQTLARQPDSLAVATMRGIYAALYCGLVEFQDKPVRYLLHPDGEAIARRRSTAHQVQGCYPANPVSAGPWL